MQSAGQPVDTLLAIAVSPIALSVLLHGLTAQPLATWYAARLKAGGQQLVELVDVPEVPERHVILGGPLRH